MENPSQSPTPNAWLEKLELDSWQAELIISGIAIYGSLQLPGLIETLVNRVIVNLPGDYHYLFYFVFWYLLLAATTFITSFIGHFLLRSLWVGLVGLASVFPNGVNTKSDLFSKHYLEQAARDFSDVRSFNQKLDELCSLMFAMSFSISLTMVAFSIQLLFAMVVSGILHSLVPAIGIKTAFLGYLGLMVLPALLGGIMNIKPLRDKPWVQKIHYPLLNKVFGKVIFLFFYRPVYYINFILNTNFTKSSLFAFFGSYFAIAIVVGSVFLLNSNAILLMENALFARSNRSDRIYSLHYADQSASEAPFFPEIESDFIDKPWLKVFVPILGRDEGILKKRCPPYKDNNKLSEKENLEAARAARTDCLLHYLTVSIDGKPVNRPSLKKYDHPRGKTPGVLLHIPLDSLPTGEHTLQIDFADQSEDGEKRRNIIPFWTKF